MGAEPLQTKAVGPERPERPCRGSSRPFTTEQTSPAGRPSLGQVGRSRKCVFVISADMRIRGKASSLPRRLFSLSRAGLLSKPREDKQRHLACQDPVCLLLSLAAGYSTAATSHLCFVFNLAFNSLTERHSKSYFQGRSLKLWSISEQYLRNSNEGGRRRLSGSPKNIVRQESMFTQVDLERECLELRIQN